MAQFAYPLVIWQDCERFALVRPDQGRRVLWEDTAGIAEAREQLQWARNAALDFRLARVSNYPFTEEGKLWTVVVDWC